MIQRAKILYTLVILFIVFNAMAQPVLLQVIPTDTLLREYPQLHVFNTEFDLKKRLEKELIYWQKQNFLEVSFDSITHDSMGQRAYLRLGKSYEIDLAEWNLYKKNRKLNTNNSTNYTAIIRAIENQLRYLDQNGYPFAQITLLPCLVSENKLQLKLHIDSNDFITYDTLLITGNSIQDKIFLMRFLNIRPNSAYNEESVKQLNLRLNQLPFLRVARPASLYFYKNKAQVIISIDDKPSNSFEGILGIRNDEKNSKEYNVTGDVNLQLNNVLASAGALKLQWRRFAALNSDLSVKAYYPYLMGAPIALSNEFSLYRQDSNFQRLKNSVGFGYIFNSLNEIQFYYAYEKSTATLTEVQLDEALAGNTLPVVNDFINKNYGIKVSYKNLDNIFNPLHGINLILDAGTGTHQLVPNSLLKGSRGLNGKLYSAYDSLPIQQATFQTYNFIDYYYPLTKRNVINIFMLGASIYHANIFFNEQLQLGGLRTFRGVNELSIKATSYALLRAEYRYILPKTGYFNLFCNGIWFESNLVNTYTKNALWGFGAGLGLQTKGGILTIVYALANENGFVFKLGKVHLGFTALF